MADQVLMPNHPMGILKMDFERILSVPFFHSSSHSIMLCAVVQFHSALFHKICFMGS